jgi:NDP-sugar pyrophosphorylase family protein
VIPVLIQAGGEGTRLRPYTMVLPKPLLPIIDTPIIEIVLRQLYHQGFRDTHISIGHLGHLLQAVLGDGERFGMNLRYIVEEQPLGTIGPLRRLPRPDGPVLVMNGDLLTDLDYTNLIEYHASADADLTISIYRCPVPVSLGVIDFDDEWQITGFREKPTLHYWASTGIYVLGPRVWDLIPPNEFFGFVALMDRVLGGALRAQAYRFDGLWMDIGRPEEYERAAEILEENRHRLLPPD